MSGRIQNEQEQKREQATNGDNQPSQTEPVAQQRSARADGAELGSVSGILVFSSNQQRDSKIKEAQEQQSR